MAIQIQGSGGSTIGEAGTTGKALKQQNSPIEYSTFGHYIYGGTTGIIPAALAANSEVFQFRWADATRLAVINRITVSACVSTTFFAAGVPVQIALVKSTVWSAAGTGGTAVAPAALHKARTSMGSSLLVSGDARIATTAALGAGTKTLETEAMANIVAPGPITASLNGQIVAPGTVLFQSDIANGVHPLVLVQNEGFSITVPAVPATGTWQMSVTVQWAEVSTY